MIFLSDWSLLWIFPQNAVNKLRQLLKLEWSKVLFLKLRSIKIFRVAIFPKFSFVVSLFEVFRFEELVIYITNVDIKLIYSDASIYKGNLSCSQYFITTQRRIVIQEINFLLTLSYAWQYEKLELTLRLDYSWPWGPHLTFHFTFPSVLING